MARLENNFPKFMNAIAEAAGEALTQTGRDVVDILHQPGFVPRATGRLQDSYDSEQIDPRTVRVGTDVPYAPFVEHGTSKMAAQPHLQPAAQEAPSILEVRLKEAIERKLGE